MTIKKLKTVVISLGGSIIVPGTIDVAFLKRFRDIVRARKDTRFLIICGGGKVCRTYQDAAKAVAVVSDGDLDWIGIRATRLNAELIRSMFGEAAYQKVVHDPEEGIDTERRIIIGAGFEPGSSTDLRAVQLAARFEADTVINMSNIDYVYDKDPNRYPDAKKIKRMSWGEFRHLVGETWDPGLSMPFDPIASREADRLRLTVVIVGNNMDNLERLLEGDAFEGSTIS